MPETAPPETARDYLLAAAGALASEMDAFNALPPAGRMHAVTTGQFSMSAWAGRATAVLKEITRDA